MDPMTLQATLQAPYSRDAWLALLRDLFGPSAERIARPAPITDPAFAGVFTRVLHLGDLTTADGKRAALLDITVAPSVSLPRHRPFPPSKPKATELSTGSTGSPRLKLRL